MYIGEIARLAGTSPKALRHYEALGLLGDVRRSAPTASTRSRTWRRSS